MFSDNSVTILQKVLSLGLNNKICLVAERASLIKKNAISLHHYHKIITVIDWQVDISYEMQQIGGRSLNHQREREVKVVPGGCHRYFFGVKVKTVKLL